VKTQGGGAGVPVMTHWIGRLSGEAAPFQAAQPFVLAGIDWQGPAQTRIELRARRVAGGWTPWVQASVLGHDSDRGETIAHALVGEPIWTGAADAVQLRSAGVVEGVNVHLVLAAAVTDRAAAAVTDRAAIAGTDAVAGTDAAAVTDAVADRGAVAATGARGDASSAQGLPLATPHLPAGPGQPPIIARSAWAGALLPRVAPSYGDVRMAFVHHSVNANGYSSAEVPAVLRSIYVFHTYVRGWNDFGYNFAVDAYGRIWEGRAGGIDRPVIGAQAGGYNVESFGAVLLGDFSETLPTINARGALAHLVAWKMALHGVPVTGQVTVEVDPPDAFYTRFRPGQHVSLPRVAGHRDGCTTDCPGEDMYVQGMPPLRRSVAHLVGRQFALTFVIGPARGRAYALDPYPIARGTKIKRATYLDLETVTATAGRQLSVHGFLRTFAGSPLKSARIAIQDLSSTRREDSEKTLTTAVTRADGLWVALLKPRSNLLLRALHADAPAAASSLIALGVKPELSLGLTPIAGGVRVSGTVTPAKDQILIELKSAGGAQRVVQRTTVEADGGNFAATMRPAPGRYWVTARTEADVANVAGESPPVAAHI
jgi:hypothetical protein